MLSRVRRAETVHTAASIHYTTVMEGQLEVSQKSKQQSKDRHSVPLTLYYTHRKWNGRVRDLFLLMVAVKYSQQPRLGNNLSVQQFGSLIIWQEVTCFLAEKLPQTPPACSPASPARKENTHQRHVVSFLQLVLLGSLERLLLGPGRPRFLVEFPGAGTWFPIYSLSLRNLPQGTGKARLMGKCLLFFFV